MRLDIDIIDGDGRAIGGGIDLGTDGRVGGGGGRACLDRVSAISPGRLEKA